MANFAGFDNTPGALEAAETRSHAGSHADVALQVDATLADFGVLLKVPDEVVAAMAAAIGDSTSMPLEVFAFLDETDVTKVIADLQVGEAPATMIHRAQAMRLYRRAKTSAVEAGVPLTGVPIARPPAAVVQPPPVKEAVPHQVQLRVSSFLDQSSEGTFPLLNPTDLRQHRLNYETVTGGPPSLAHRPTDEQLCALRALLATGRAPYADFAVFGPFDEKTAKLRKYSDQVFVDGALHTRLLHGPATFDAWLGCWNVFKTAMIMLKASTLHDLGKCEEGIRGLVTTYRAWSVIAQAEDCMRHVQWAIVADEFRHEGTLGADDESPWSNVIANSSFSVTNGCRAYWWWVHVTGPLTSGRSGAAALNIVDEMEGRVAVESRQPPSKKRKMTSNQFAPARAKSSSSKAPQRTSIASEVCYLWNDGKCPDGPCPKGRKHVCRNCGQSHKGMDCAKSDSKSGGGKGGTKKKKSSGKGGKFGM